MFKIIILLASLGLYSLSASANTSDQELDFNQIVEAIDATIHEQHFNPSQLQQQDYQATLKSLHDLAASVKTREEFLNGFRKIWKNGPFSHTVLAPAGRSAEATASYLDTIRIGGGGAILTWRSSIAILTVKTMMGQDTIEEINAAYEEIHNKQPSALIIDLRENGGGAFAIKPLISHLLDQPYIAGAFIAQKWNQSHARPPKASDLQKLEAWEGWSVRSFWTDVQNDIAVKVQFSPTPPQYSGPVYVLTSNKTASAAELASDALQASGRATIVGEKTAGEMLSQKPFDIPGRMHLYVPIADYYSSQNGRIEGTGVTPNIMSPAKDALNVALEIISKE